MYFFHILDPAGKSQTPDRPLRNLLAGWFRTPGLMSDTPCFKATKKLNNHEAAMYDFWEAVFAELKEKVSREHFCLLPGESKSPGITQTCLSGSKHHSRYVFDIGTLQQRKKLEKG